MDNVIYIIDYKARKNVKNANELYRRVMVLQTSIDRINKLMAELRATK